MHLYLAIICSMFIFFIVCMFIGLTGSSVYGNDSAWEEFYIGSVVGCLIILAVMVLTGIAFMLYMIWSTV